MSRFSARNFVTPQEADPVASVKLVRGRFKSGRRSWSGDERGITLQTLIVTAVLVLMAVAAGVIIVAITDNSADDLEDQASDIDGRCQPWEIHDTELEAIGAGGGKEHLETLRDLELGRTGQGGVTSSKVGCLAPCYLQAKTSEAFKPMGPKTLLEIINFGGAEAKLLFDTTNRPPMDPTPNGIADGEYRLGVTYLRTTSPMIEVDTFKTSKNSGEIPRYRHGDMFTSHSAIRALGTNVPPAGDKTAIRVTAGQDACIIFNTDTGVILLDSRDS